MWFYNPGVQSNISGHTEDCANDAAQMRALCLYSVHWVSSMELDSSKLFICFQKGSGIFQFAYANSCYVHVAEVCMSKICNVHRILCSVQLSLIYMYYNTCSLLFNS